MTDDPTAQLPVDDDSDLSEDEELDDEEHDDTDAAETDAQESVAARPTDRAHGAPRHRASPPTSAAGLAARDRRRGIVVDPSLRIRDRWSQAFVVGTVLVFALIFFNALAFGQGGALTGTPTPPPSVAASAGPSESAGSSAAPSPTAEPTPTAAPTPAPTATPPASVEPSPS